MFKAKIIDQNKSINITISYEKNFGDVEQTVKVNDNENNILIKDVQCVPDLCANLLSVAQVVKNDNVIVISKNGCSIYNNKKNHRN